GRSKRDHADGPARSGLGGIVARRPAAREAEVIAERCVLIALARLTADRRRGRCLQRGRLALVVAASTQPDRAKQAEQYRQKAGEGHRGSVQETGPPKTLRLVEERFRRPCFLYASPVALARFQIGRAHV